MQSVETGILLTLSMYCMSQNEYTTQLYTLILTVLICLQLFVLQLLLSEYALAGRFSFNCHLLTICF